MVLLVVVRLGDDAYGVPISQELLNLAGREVAVGSIYAALDRLEQKGLVTSKLGDPTPERGGRAKRYFRVTPAGARALVRSGPQARATSTRCKASTDFAQGAGLRVERRPMAERHVARGHESGARLSLRCSTSELRLLPHGARRRAPVRVVAARMAAGRRRTTEVLPVHTARQHPDPGVGQSHQTALAHRARLPRTQARVRFGSLRGAQLARLPSSCNPFHRCLRVPASRAPGGAKKNSATSPSRPDPCRTRRLPATRLPYDASATSPTRSEHCAWSWRPLSSRGSIDVLAAE